MKVKIYGPGCSSCIKLTKNVKKAAKELGVVIELEKVEDVQQMMANGVVTSPGLEINGELKSVGRVLNKDEIKKMIK